MRHYFLYFAWVITLIGFIFSFYYGELLHIEPCHLCWYQRMALFPLAVLLGIATYRNDRNIIPYAILLACFGAVVALFQALSIRFPVFQEMFECGKECAKPMFIFFGFVALPDLSFLGFAAICLLLLASRKVP